MKRDNIEIEVRFLEIDVKDIKEKLIEVGAVDLGEDFLREYIFYDKTLSWQAKRKLVRLRQTKNGVYITYKHKRSVHSIDVKEVEIQIDSWDKGKKLLEEIGLVAYREQEKRRHSYTLGEVIIDIDTWPTIPPYIELEGPSKKVLQETAEALGLPWEKAVFAGAGYVIENYYHIPVLHLKHFTFKKIE
jgi:adenylate cyclase class 2